jgi:hypothetical protein
MAHREEFSGTDTRLRDVTKAQLHEFQITLK